MEDPAFPVEATTTSPSPCLRAKAATKKEALSFNEPVGLTPSSFKYNSGKAYFSKRFPGCHRGVFPTGIVGKNCRSTGKKSIGS